LDINIVSIFTNEDARIVGQRLPMLPGDWPIINKRRDEIKTFFKDKDKENRIFPNEQEITAYLQRYHNHSGFDIHVILDRLDFSLTSIDCKPNPKV
jgi:hypothetical protein